MKRLFKRIVLWGTLGCLAIACGQSAGVAAGTRHGHAHSTAAKSKTPRIAFSYQNSIWTIAANGKGLKRLTSTGLCVSPSWSPEGKHILYTSGTSGKNSNNDYLWVMNSNGTEKRRLSQLDDNGGSSPCWMRDSKRTVFVLDGQIWIMNINGTGKHQLTHLKGGGCQSTVVSPDGKRIVFNATRSGSNSCVKSLNSIRPNGSGLATLISERCSNNWETYAGICFSPDGTKILYVNNPDTGTLYSYSFRTHRVNFLYGNGKQQQFYDCNSPSFSPDGRKVVCQTSGWGSPETGYDQKMKGIVLMNSDGTNVKRILASSQTPVWSQNGQELVISTGPLLQIYNIGTKKTHSIFKSKSGVLGNQGIPSVW